MDNFIEDQRIVNVQANKEIETIESSLSKELDGFDKKFDIMQQSISLLTNQVVHQEEENFEEECLIDTTMEEQCKQQDETIFPLLTAEGNRKDAVKGTQNPILQPIPVNLDPSATVQPKNNPLPVHILPTPAPHATPKTPIAKAIPPLLPTQYFRKLVVTAKIFATTSKKLSAAHTTWHSGWFGCWFRYGEPGP